MTDWKEVYHKYRSLDDPIKKQQISRSTNPSGSEPFENIYEAAFHLHQMGNREEWYFRGQRKSEWGLTPSLFRDSKDIDVDFEIQRLSSAVRFVQSELKVSQEIALAIVQHYSSVPETKIRTWLLDVTESPEVACFFASIGGSEGETGAVYLFKEYEMERLGSSTPKQLGGVEIISPEGVPRIEKQRAAFINHAHPELLEGYLPFNWTFKQYDDVVLEYAPLGISKDNLLETNDEYEDLLEHWENTVWPENIPPSQYVAPPHDPMGEIEYEDYLSIVKEWLDEMGKPYRGFSEEGQMCINDLCRVHARLSASNEISPLLTSEHTLQQILRTIIGYAETENRELSFTDVVSRYWHESVRENRDEVERIIQSVRPGYNFER
ncbi:FRG domain-containing protein [Haloarchaeobius sp. HME9146]|uniref:FRG domain-containing protein n=1 Tax=Haloarchaeobius sp. HME9146 TaxID=2978732 RepID=UPI0021BE37C0|nr:FRG domain-containing protein [Haloarchaeobius sp. HME9146]MCT9095275.1 FRG domain-containing protein [Haloarchaeobius sp. HME9146]